jgi:hypothetical protein
MNWNGGRLIAMKLTSSITPIASETNGIISVKKKCAICPGLHVCVKVSTFLIACVL